MSASESRSRAFETPSPVGGARAGRVAVDIFPSPKTATRAMDEIAAHFRAMVADGQLKPGDRLPAERDLAQRLQVSRNTVREALRTLEHAGLLELAADAPVGQRLDRSVVAAYDIDPVAMTAREAWRFDAGPALRSPFCSRRSTRTIRPGDDLSPWTAASIFWPTRSTHACTRSSCAFMLAKPSLVVVSIDAIRSSILAMRSDISGDVLFLMSVPEGAVGDSG